MSEDGLSIHVQKAEGRVLSERTANALEELAKSVVIDLEEESEVSGFGALDIGSTLGPRISGPAPLEVCIGLYSGGGSGSEDSEGGSKEREKESCYGIFF